MILKQRRIDDIKLLNLRTKAFNYCLVNLSEHKKDKEK